MNKLILGLLLLICFPSQANDLDENQKEQDREVTYRINAEGAFNSQGENTPYFLLSNKQGLSSIEPNNGYLRLGAFLPLREKRGWDFGFGIDLVGAGNYQSPFLIHQLYAEVQWECLDLLVGSKEYSGEIRNPYLSSGGLTWSGNARPIPMIKGGIFDYVKIPKIPLEIKLHVSYGRFTDDRYKEKEFGYNNSYFTTETWYHDKKIFFRSPSQHPFVVTLGAEVSSQFGGRRRAYLNSQLYDDHDPNIKFKDFFNVLFAGQGDSRASIGDQVFAYGNHLGSLNLQFEYTFRNQSVIKLYGEDQWEDGSGLIKQNGFDGLWGIEWSRRNAQSHRYLKGIVIEYFQSTNQSGPTLFWPSDYPLLVAAGISGIQSTGADNYYNNYFYDSWSHWGQTAGTPLIVAPAYNKNGFLLIRNNRIKALHIGLTGEIIPTLDYRFLAHLRKGWGTPFIPLIDTNNNFSMMIELNYSPKFFNGWKATGAFSLDRGTMIGNNTGFMISISKSGSLFKF